MRRSLLPLLPLVALVLMGNSCEFAARSGSPPPPRSDAEGPVQGPVQGNGLLIRVRVGDIPSSTQARPVFAVRAIVGAALGVSALSASGIESGAEPGTTTVEGPASPGEPWLRERVESLAAHSARPVSPSSPVGAIPEPGAGLLFAVGLTVCARCLGRGASPPTAAKAG